MKKKIAIMLAVVLVFGLSVFGVVSQNKVYAKTAQMHLEIPDFIKKEQEFTVTVVLESDVQLYSIDAYLSYNAELLEFVPDNNCVTGAEGVLELRDVYEEETKKATYDITFKALETGKTEVALTDVYLIDYADLDYITVTPSAKSFEIGINRLVAEDARLQELVVAPGVFTQEFDPNVLEYEMHVDIDVTTVGVSAIPMDESSVIALDMPDELQLGINVIKVTVTALSGNVNEYIITVIREDIEESSDEESVDDISTEEENASESTQDNPVENTTEETTEDTTEESTEGTTEESTEDTTEEVTEGTKEDNTKDSTQVTNEEVPESTKEEATKATNETIAEGTEESGATKE